MLVSLQIIGVRTDETKGNTYLESELSNGNPLNETHVCVERKDIISYANDSQRIYAKQGDLRQENEW